MLATQIGAAPPPDRPSAADFGALPVLADPVIAPGGARLAARTLADGKTRLMIAEIATGSRSFVALPEGADLDWFRWAGDGTLLIELSTTATLLGLQLRLPRLLAYDVATHADRRVATAGEGLGRDIVHIDPAGRFILETGLRSYTATPSVYRVDLATNAVIEVVPPRPHVWSWFADSAGVVRTGIGVDNERWWIDFRTDAAAPFVSSPHHDGRADRDQIDTLALAPGASRGFAVATGESGRFGLYHYDFTAGQIGALIYENPVADVTDVDVGADGQPASVSYTDDRARVMWFDPGLRAVQTRIERALPGMSVRLTSFSTDRQRLIVWATAADNPGAYYLFDRRTGQLMLIAAPYERLAGKRLAEMTPVTYAARDGLPIPAYLTVPPGREPRDAPMVVLPHGGPFARDEWGYDVWAQSLASRGYVVLQPNFRGSTGYGRRFVERGYGQWGRGMQDDIDDGVRWLIGRSIVDAHRVCIMGGSFGGYAAEWGAVRNPDLYRCAISLAGVSDIKAQLSYNRRDFAAPRYFRDWRERVQGADTVSLDALSPLKRAADLRIPLFIAHGDADTVVPPEQSRRLMQALTRAGHPPDYHVYPGEGHGFSKPEDQVDFLQRVEAFLTRYNPA
ncbi:alpha/beta hydrolase family protein [Sphingomonas sp.]|uniref:alpha/beta hydrolase family protein n=1 Tax=Sphingomonas sp. TaxID=28214 RepID=UPI003CC60E48